MALIRWKHLWEIWCVQLSLVNILVSLNSIERISKNGRQDWFQKERNSCKGGSELSFTWRHSWHRPPCRRSLLWRYSWTLLPELRKVTTLTLDSDATTHPHGMISDTSGHLWEPSCFTKVNTSCGPTACSLESLVWVIKALWVKVQPQRWRSQIPGICHNRGKKWFQAHLKGLYSPPQSEL